MKELNTKIQTVPTNLINKMFGHFEEREYYEVDEAESKQLQTAPKVEF